MSAGIVSISAVTDRRYRFKLFEISGLSSDRKKIQLGKTMEILIKRNDPAVSEAGQGRKIAIRPKSVNDAFLKRVFHEYLIHPWGIQNEAHMGFDPVSLINLPSLI
jgi:hypothetical protein